MAGFCLPSFLPSYNGRIFAISKGVLPLLFPTLVIEWIRSFTMLQEKYQVLSRDIGFRLRRQ